MKYIIDTHALVWFLADDERLGRKAKRILTEANGDEIIIPVIVLLEAIDIQEKKKVDFDMRALFDFLAANDHFTVLDLTFSHVRELVEIGHGLDLHDRIICTVARLTHGIVVTKDSEIKQHAETIW